MHSTLFIAEPFPVQSALNLSGDQRTRIMLFATNLTLFGGETPSSVSVSATDSRGFTYHLAVDQVLKLPNFAWLSSVIVRLPDDQTINGDLSVTVSLRGAVSNAVRVGIRGP